MKKDLSIPHEDLIAKIQKDIIELNKHTASLKKAEQYMLNGPYNPFPTLQQWMAKKDIYKN